MTISNLASMTVEYLEDLVILYYFAIIVGGIVNGIIWGFITQKINESKGYYGGFAWGFWLGVIGLIVVLCRPRIDYTPTSSYYNNQNSPAPATSSNNGWLCTCGKQHSAYESSCVCGRTKYTALSEAKQRQAAVAAPAAPAAPVATPVAAPAAAPAAKSEPVKEADNIELLKKYKTLLDDGVITQEEFDTKKKQLLGL